MRGQMLGCAAVAAMARLARPGDIRQYNLLWHARHTWSWHTSPHRGQLSILTECGH